MVGFLGKRLTMVLFVIFFIMGVLSAVWYFQMWGKGMMICMPGVNGAECLKAKIPLIDVFLKNLFL